MELQTITLKYLTGTPKSLQVICDLVYFENNYITLEWNKVVGRTIVCGPIEPSWLLDNHDQKDLVAFAKEAGADSFTLDFGEE